MSRRCPDYRMWVGKICFNGKDFERPMFFSLVLRKEPVLSLSDLAPEFYVSPVPMILHHIPSQSQCLPRGRLDLHGLTVLPLLLGPEKICAHLALHQGRQNVCPDMCPYLSLGVVASYRHQQICYNLGNEKWTEPLLSKLRQSRQLLWRLPHGEEPVISPQKLAWGPHSIISGLSLEGLGTS